MNMRILAVSVLLSAFVCNSAFALAPMGPPTATLKTGHFRAGFDFSTSKTDIKAKWDNGDDELWKEIQSNLFAANIGYGICDDWEIFIRLGVANAEYDEVEFEGETIPADPLFDGDYGFLFGLGTKVTWAKQENINWGALFQIHWLNAEDSASADLGGGFRLDLDQEIDLYEIQVAVGPTWNVNETLSIYGGPFFHFIAGDADLDTTTIDTSDGSVFDSSSSSADLEEDSCFGGYVGAQYELSTNASVYAEFQFTGDAWGFGTGVGWKF